jgi:hypothetical protein
MLQTQRQGIPEFNVHNVLSVYRAAAAAAGMTTASASATTPSPDTPLT